MFKLKIHGRVHRVGPGELLVAVPHHEQGHASPTIVECGLAQQLATAAADLAEGDPVWLEGNAYQARTDDGLLHIAMFATMLTSPRPSLIDGRGAMFATVHGVISSDPELAKIDSGARAGQDVLRFGLHISVPEMERTRKVVMRVKVWNGEASWIGANHQRADRINLEGNLHELRFTDTDGIPRTAHQLVAAEWWFAKDRLALPATVVSERVTSRPVCSAPVVIRRG